MELPSKQQISKAYSEIAQFVHADSPTEEELCDLRVQIATNIGIDLSWLSLCWLRNELVKARKASLLKNVRQRN